MNSLGTHKYSMKWKGPGRIVSCKSDMVFEINYLISKKRIKVHARRMLLYRADMDGTEVEPKPLKQAEFSEGIVHIAEALHSIRWGGTNMEIVVE